MSTYSVSNFPLDGWYEENTINPKLNDIAEAKEVMKFIGDTIGDEFRLIKPLDIERFGANTPPNPEARFEFTHNNQIKNAVIEIKQFGYIQNLERESLLFTLRPLNKWFKDFHHAHADKDYIILFKLKIKGNKLDPRKALNDLKQSDPFAGVSTNYFELKAVKWPRYKDYILPNGKEFNIPKDKFIVIEEINSPLDVRSEIQDSINYERHVDRLYGTWTQKKWDKKFNEFKDDSKYLYLKIIMSSESQIAVRSEDFSVKDFIDTLIRKYGTTKSISQLQGILIFAGGTYQFLEMKETGLILHPPNEQFKPRLAAPFI